MKKKKALQTKAWCLVWKMVTKMTQMATCMLDVVVIWVHHHLPAARTHTTLSAMAMEARLSVLDGRHQP
eukprot:CAMPEP_0206491754 /NCGR_PEP_ID=MMETSP0324_2-20121206/45357_1 /ASSEMBLY_ACC=CAM_ASM_000836 /TAXON_ID=2866 /ORGANISM="Crypthecodinium cohnii, Strain Seligo" /LENGTH=68 /DNA_ID=CAMNT_0053973351 /DNA_START=204 /DNA_END=406 /DNA_ORIENTATION=-